MGSLHIAFAAHAGVWSWTTDKPVRSVITYNRWDCCVERAVPLVLELSLDGERYWEAATRRDPFYVWSATFAAQRARYVRLRVIGPSTLHLTRVEIR